jgi:hypothetical protein
LGNFLKRLEIFTTVPPAPILIDIIFKIMVESLLVLALATKQIEQGRFGERALTYTLLAALTHSMPMCHREFREKVIG